jgi:hypothetical protein
MGLKVRNTIPNCAKGTILLIIVVVSIFVIFLNEVGLSALWFSLDDDKSK